MTERLDVRRLVMSELADFHEMWVDPRVTVGVQPTNPAALVRKLQTRNRLELATCAYETRRIPT